LSKVYHTRQGEISALEDASLSAEGHEFVCIVGPSGCGKTTLLKLMAGLLEPTSGEIVGEAGPASDRPLNAMVFQEHGLFPWMTVWQNAAFGLEMQGVPRTERHRLAARFADRFGLGEFANSYPHELSGGMRRKVAISRAFLTDPQMLLMDEPFGALDAQTRLVLQEELLQLWSEHKKLVIYVTHDIEEAILLGDRVLVMSGRPGSIREEIRIPLSRPRKLQAGLSRELREIRHEIWKMLEDEVRHSLQLTA
jgi:NitT/TauT family transport system ATP-binding protein